MAMDFSTDESYGNGITYDAMSQGDHTLQITQARLDRSKNGDAMLVLRVTDRGNGPEDGFSFRHYIVLREESWGLGRLVKLCRAIGVKGCSQVAGGLDPSDQASVHQHLLGACFVGRVEKKTEKRNDGQGDFVSNDVKSYKAVPPLILAQWEAQHGTPHPELPDDAYETERPSRDGGRSSSGGSSASFANDPTYDADSFADSDIPF